mmetsp:Transcript_21916/g.37593  ORF Transcript_21916/g.37593 Transcript_21916/m.37593 type:complete len:190 (-) Transcript_21916:38-607(-)|eukprot:CAMPEP_0196661070 /NCGR_PEP_ID=MMETSP1086-20130531/42515_1 /TAXON_ID=77921 /ORGANISM="Cyanoptyche  gloeocystis , Strain SAG4.97" /LENGTH=189 /DNA_ID=CAMNT_0041995805 /DNA_START=113 /DNA_END=682 /DNA_ORIENTATION=+
MIKKGVTGSVAAIKTGLLSEMLSSIAKVKIVSTENGLVFFSKEDIKNEVPVITDSDDWKSWEKKGDPVLHIELRRWADILVIAPLSANSLAKISAGICDNLLLCVARAWDFRRPFLVAPAMNTMMWEHPATAQQLDVVRRWGVTVIPPVCKTLACGDSGIGAMAEVDTIISAVSAAAASHSLQPMSPAT